MKEIRGKTLKEWKEYCKDESIPIKTMKYIFCLEEQIKALTTPVVSQQRELLTFKDWFNNLPDDSDDRLYITDETISRFKANCG